MFHPSVQALPDSVTLAEGRRKGVMVTAGPFSDADPSPMPSLPLFLSTTQISPPLSTGLPSTHNPVPSWVWPWQFPGEVRGGGDVSSWGPGQAWLPLWKSPTPPSPAQPGRGPCPLLCRNTRTFVLLTPFHVPHLVSFTAQDGERRGQRLVPE